MTLQDAPRPVSPESSNNPALDALLGRAFEQKSLCSGLCENIRDALFPRRLPSLELTSTPIAVPDRMAAKTNPWAIGTATLVNGSILALILSLGLKAVVNPAPKSASRAHVDLSQILPFAPKLHAASGGGGGGANDSVDPIQGQLPHFEKMPLAPLQLPQ